MAEFPDAIYVPRTKANDPSAAYVPTDPYTIFAEDVQQLDAEVVAIEETLGLNPEGAFTDVAERLDDIDTVKQDALAAAYALANFTDPGNGVASAAVGGTVGVFVHGYVAATPSVGTSQLQTFQVETAIASGVYTTVQVAGVMAAVGNAGGAHEIPFNFFVPSGRKWRHNVTGAAAVSSLSAITL